MRLVWVFFFHLLFFFSFFFLSFFFFYVPTRADPLHVHMPFSYISMYDACVCAGGRALIVVRTCTYSTM